MDAVPSTARRLRRPIAAAAAVLAGAVAGAPAHAAPMPLPEAPDCPLFPADSHWNLRVDRLPRLEGSKRIVRSIGLRGHVHGNFGGGEWAGGPDGTPITVVPGSQERVPISFRWPQWSDPGPYPFPPSLRPMYAGDPSADHLAVVVDRDDCRLYETYRTKKLRGGRAWRADAGATWSLRSNRLRPDGWTSADGAGLPILPGLVRWEEVRRGRIDHALRLAVPATGDGWIYPARHDTGGPADPGLPRYGQRLRLKRGFDISRFPRQARVILRAMKRYGVIVAEEGVAWRLSGEPDPSWSYGELQALHRVTGRHFEVVDTARLARPGE
jgi:hypothetical protein